MQYEPSGISYNNQSNVYPNQYPSLHQPSCETGNPSPPYSGLPPYTQYSQQSINNPAFAVPNAAYYGQTPPYQQQGVLFIPMHQVRLQARVLTTITGELRAFFIISGIMYLLWGASAIGLEVAILMYSYSTYYRGIWAGSIMLGAGISMLIVASRISYSMVFIIRLLAFVLAFSIVGVVLSALDFGTSKRCTYDLYNSFCDRQIAHTLKMSILIILCLATIQTGVNLSIAGFTQKKSASTPPAASAPNHQY